MLRRPAVPGLTGHDPLVRGIRRGLATVAFAMTCSLASTAGAEELPPGVELGARLGYGLPLGDVDTHDALEGTVGDPLDQTVRGIIPLWIDGGYRFGPRWFGGLFFAYAPGLPGGVLENACGNRALDCTVFDMRAGAEVHYHLAPGDRWDPWLGAGLGYEWLHLGVSRPPFSLGAESWASGFELANLQAGLDIPIGPRVRLGPFAAMTTAVYSWNDTLPSSSTFTGPALHAWFVLGIRGAIDLAPRPAAPAADGSGDP
jgi:hypothetical protein